MAGFDDLIPEAMPYLATEERAATAGTAWRWEYELRDSVGTLIDLSTGYTATAGICLENSTTSVVTIAVTFPSTGVVRCSVTAANSAVVTPGIYYSEVTVTRTSDSAKVILVGAGDAKFIVKRKASA